MNPFGSLISILIPTPCAVCKEPLSDLRCFPCCPVCWETTEFFLGDETLCAKCGRFHSDSPSIKKTFCRECDNDFYDFAGACGKYRKGLESAVLTLKKTPRVSEAVAEQLFKRYVSAGFSVADVVVPIPLSRKRLFQRGFNQAELLADSFSNVASIDYDKHSLRRTKHSDKSRAGMDRKGRAISVVNAFQVKRASLVRNKSVLLIDDVFTTGATGSMAAKALKKAGAGKVELLTLARAGN